MADGDLVVANHQLEVRSFLMGATTSYKIRNWGPILGHSAKKADLNLGSDHGLYAGVDYLAGESKVFEVIANGTSEANMHSLVDDLRDKWLPGATVPLTFRQDGTIGKRRIYGRTRDLDVILNPEFPTIARCLLEFQQTDPRSYSHTQNSQAYAAGATTAITNAGNIETSDVVITFAATSTGAKLLHNGSGLYIDFDTYTISGTSYVVTISNGGLTVLQGTTNKYGELLATSEALGFRFAAGSNSLTYTTDSGTGGCTVAWRDAYA